MSDDQARPGSNPPPGHLPHFPLGGAVQPYGAYPPGPPPGHDPGVSPGPYGGPGYPPPGYPPPYPHPGARPDQTAQIVIYVLLLLGFFMAPFTPIAALITAYVNRGGGDWIADSHYTYAIRTVWIGTLYAVAGVALAFVLVGFLVLLFVAVWWLVRCIKGLSLVNRGQPIPDPATWLW